MKNFEEILEAMECEACGNVGMLSNGGYFCICPNCGEETTIMHEGFPVEDLEDEECVSCGTVGEFVVNEENHDHYMCLVCHYEGSIKEDFRKEITQ